METWIPEGLAVIVVGFAVGRLELSSVVAEELEVENDGWRGMAMEGHTFVS